jgi:hypothetical protein
MPFLSLSSLSLLFNQFNQQNPLSKAYPQS